jgi:hypothetical protein
MLAMLASALRQYQQQQRISALGVRAARRLAVRGPRAVARGLSAYQAASVDLVLESAPIILDEQGISTDATADVNPSWLLTGDRASELYDKAASDAAFDRLTLSLIQDAGRTAAAVDNATRPAVTAYVRSLNPPSCGRCAVLAGRVYRYSTSFQRHPKCDCLMTPTTEAIGKDLVTDPTDLAQRGQVRGLSKGDQFAIDNGADLGQVVNVRRKEAGLTVGSSVIERAGRLTPQGCLSLAPDRTEALSLLKRFGYIK